MNSSRNGFVSPQTTVSHGEYDDDVFTPLTSNPNFATIDFTSIPLKGDSEILISARSRQNSRNDLDSYANANESDHLIGRISKYNSATGYGSGSGMGSTNSLQQLESGNGNSGTRLGGSMHSMTDLLSGSNGTPTDRIASNPQQHSVLYKLSNFTIPFVITSYIILQSSAGYFNSFCTEPYHLETWVRHVHLLTILWFSLHIIYNVYHMIHEANWKSSEAFYAYAHGLCVLFIVFSSTILSFTKNTPWTPLCRDGFGVVSRVAQWPEWIVTVPLLFYIALSCDNDKQTLGNYDMLMIFFMFLVIFNGFLLNMHVGSFAANIGFLSISCLAMVCIIYIAVTANSDIEKQIRDSRFNNYNLNWDITWDPSDITQRARTHAFERLKKLEMKFQGLNLAHKKRNMALVCLFGLPMFPAIYFLALFRVVSDEWTVVLYAIVGFLFKSVMVGLLVAGHISLYEDMRFEQAAGAIKRELKENQKYLGFSENKYYKTNFEITSKGLNPSVAGGSTKNNQSLANQTPGPLQPLMVNDGYSSKYSSGNSRNSNNSPNRRHTSNSVSGSMKKSPLKNSFRSTPANSMSMKSALKPSSTSSSVGSQQQPFNNAKAFPSSGNDWMNPTKLIGTPFNNASSLGKQSSDGSSSHSTVPNPFEMNTFKIVTNPVNPLTVKSSTGAIKNFSSLTSKDTTKKGTHDPTRLKG